MRRKPTLTRLKAKLWEEFSKYIRKKSADKNGYTKCVSCGKIAHWKDLQAGHFVPKSLSLSIYFYERNVHPQCYRCNICLNGHLSSYALYLVHTYGAKILEELNKEKNKITKYTRNDYEELIQKYRQKFQNLNNT